MANSLYDLAATSVSGEQIDFAQFRGRPVLIVNTASRCGFTPQYEGLQKLHESFGPEGLVIIGFPCDQFANQEPGDETQIEQFCRINYGVTFLLTQKVEVNGRGTHPVFAFVKERTGGLLGSSVKWNFTKFLVAPDGRTVTRYSPSTDPAELVQDVERLLRSAAA